MLVGCSVDVYTGETCENNSGDCWIEAHEGENNTVNWWGTCCFSANDFVNPLECIDSLENNVTEDILITRDLTPTVVYYTENGVTCR